MAEAKTEELVNQYVDQIVEVVETEMGTN